MSGLAVAAGILLGGGTGFAVGTITGRWWLAPPVAVAYALVVAALLSVEVAS